MRVDVCQVLASVLSSSLLVLSFGCGELPKVCLCYARSTSEPAPKRMKYRGLKNREAWSPVICNVRSWK